MASSEPPPREVVETEEYTAQYDDIVAKYTVDVIGPILTGLIEGIAKNPRAMEQLTGNLWMVRSKDFGLTIPRFTVFFSIEGANPEDEKILLLWIEENKTTDEIIGNLA
jgi:hypothetical protein